MSFEPDKVAAGKAKDPELPEADWHGDWKRARLLSELADLDKEKRRYPMIAVDRIQIEHVEARICELYHYLAKLIGLVGVISPGGSCSAVAEWQTPLPPSG
jgi:hypothetical protein